MRNPVSISVVIPTCNRTESLQRTLRSLNQTEYDIGEIIIVDSSDGSEMQRQLPDLMFKIRYVRAEKSVCIQRNIGIQQAIGAWIFLCDDDIEVPPTYLSALVSHATEFPNAGAISGLVLQQEHDRWQVQYPVHSFAGLWWNSIFNLGIWGDVRSDNALSRKYKKKGNYISKAGWPVVTDFSGDYFTTPVYGLGASLVKREWLLQSPYDEVLDRSGIGDNYGVAMGFPTEGIHVVTGAHVYHHREKQNRMGENLSYYRRLLALDYFITIGKCKDHVRRGAYRWSLIGNFVRVMKSGEMKKAFATMKAFLLVTCGRNPYVVGKLRNQKVVQPTL